MGRAGGRLMANSLEQLRLDLVAALNVGGLHAHPVVPERISPPATFVTPASDPYVTLEGASYGHCIVRHQITLAVGSAPNATTAAEIDRRLLVLLAVLPDDFAVETSGVGRVPLNAQEYVGAAVTVLSEIPLPPLSELPAPSNP